MTDMGQSIVLLRRVFASRNLTAHTLRKRPNAARWFREIIESILLCQRAWRALAQPPAENRSLSVTFGHLHITAEAERGRAPTRLQRVENRTSRRGTSGGE